MAAAMGSSSAAGDAPLTGLVLALPVPGAAPLDELAGLPLALRAVLTLQKEGAKRVVLAVAPDDERTIARVTGDARVRVPVEGVKARDAGELAERLEAPVVVARHDVIVDPAVYRALVAEPLDDAAAIVATQAGAPIGPCLAGPAAIAAMRLDAPPSALAGLAGARTLDVGARWAARATDQEGRDRAFFQLFEACRKPMDGVVSQNLNRHISIFISKRLVGLRLTPNMLSVFTFLLGVAGAVAAARGGYWGMLLGAFLFQWNSILDGCDGELARVRFQHSTLGQWLDTVSDDTSNLVFYAGVAIGSAGLPHGRELAICGVVGIVTSIAATAQFYVEMAQRGTGDLYAIDWGFDKAPPKGLAGRLIVFFRNALKKDFAILFFLALAVFGVLPYALPVVAGAAIGNLIAATLRNVRRRSAARAA
jgi:phosphatidylglycerophosphate synthase